MHGRYESGRGEGIGRTSDLREVREVKAPRHGSSEATQDPGYIRELWRCSIHHFLNDGYSWSLYPLLPLIAVDFGLSYTGAGVIKTLMTALQSSLGIPFGMLAERIGDLTVLTLGTTVFALGMALMALTWSYPSFLAVVFASGAGAASSHPVSSSLVSRRAPAARMGTYIAIFNFAGDVGKTVLPVVAAFIAHLFGWRAALFGIGAAGVVVALGLHRIKAVPSGDDGRSDEEEGAEEGQEEEPAGGWGVLNWWAFGSLHLVGIIDSLSRSGVAVFASFLLLDKGFSQAALGGFLGLLAAGGAAGKLVCGPLADITGRRSAVMYTEILTSLGIVGLLYSRGHWVGPMMVLLGIFLNGTSSVLYALVPWVTEEHRRSRGYALYYTVTLAASGLAPLILGVIADAFGLHLMFYVMAVSLLLTVPLSFMLAEA